MFVGIDRVCQLKSEFNMRSKIKAEPLFKLMSSVASVRAALFDHCPPISDWNGRDDH